jgi:hypothetical protein
MSDLDARTCLHCGYVSAYPGFHMTCGLCDRCYARDFRAKRRHKQRTCAACEVVFTTTRVDAKFCSAACRQKAYRAAKSACMIRIAITAAAFN